MSILEKLRLGFLSRLRRERLLIVSFIVALAALWLVIFVGRVRAFAPELSRLKSEADAQAVVLAQREAIDAEHAATIAALSSESGRPTGNEARGIIDQLIRGAGYTNFRIDPPAPDRRDKLTFHPITVNLYRVEWLKLRELFDLITSRLPTVNLAEVLISVPDRNQPTLHDARFKFVAIEINR